MLLHDVYAPEGRRATFPAYLYEKNSSTFHDITSCEFRRRESSIAYSSVLRRMTDSLYFIRRPRIVHCTIQLFRAFIFKRERERDRSMSKIWHYRWNEKNRITRIEEISFRDKTMKNRGIEK